VEILHVSYTGFLCGLTFLKSPTSDTSPGDGVDLVEWGAAETAVTVIATSIPILRALFKELRSTARSYGKSTSKDGMPHSRSHITKSVAHVHSRPRPVSQEGLNDSDSDRSIWPGGKPYIMKTDEITLTYDDRPAGKEPGYEMGVVGGSRVRTT
jgi:hypothetical protein